jgi:hypothetical protein
MRRPQLCIRNPILSGAFYGVMLIALTSIPHWITMSKMRRDADRIQKQQLIEVIGPLLARAVAIGDDLEQIALLKRLEKLPHVVSAQLFPARNASPEGTLLTWDGKRVGQLLVTVSGGPKQRFGLQLIESAVTWGTLFAIFGGFLGWKMNRARRLRQARLALLLTRRRANERCARTAHGIQVRRETLAYVWHAIRKHPNALILLDGHHRLTAFNRAAAEAFRLRAEDQGRHWLQLQSDPRWAAALQSSLEHPEIAIHGPGVLACKTEAITHFDVEQGSQSTWLRLA